MSRLLKIGLVLLLFLGSAPLMYAQIARTNQATGKSSFNPTNPAEPDTEFKDDGEEDEKEDIEVVYYEVTVSSNPSSAGNISNGGKFTSGSYIYVYTSLKNSKYKFSHWTLNGDFYSKSQSFTYKIDTVDANFVAHYEFVPSSPVEPSPMPEEPEKPVKKVVPLFLTTNIEGVCTFNQSSGHEYEEGTWVSLEAFVAKGYEFKGWYEGTTLISKNKTLRYQIPSEASTLIAYVEKIVYNPNNPSEPEGSQDDVAVGSYNLIYVVDGEEYKTILVKFGTPITSLDPLYKEGYTFSGWSEVPTTMPANDIVITGSFSINSYTVTYIVDGEEYKSVTFKYGESVMIDEVPMKEGHTFSGWSEIPATMPAGDVIVTGSFTVNSYTLTYTVDGEEYSKESVVYGSALTPLASPEKEGHTFSGWGEIPATMPAGDVIVTGNFTINSYTLTYTVDGEEYDVVTVVYGAEIAPLAEPTKEGHTFSGWSEIPATMPAENVVVTGNFTINSYTLTYMVDGEEYDVATAVYGTELTPLAAPEKDGYTFSGWSGLPATMPARDITVVGSFVINGYTLTYVVDGEVYRILVYEYGSIVIAEPIPVKEGYTFSGWSGLPAIMPASDVTISGTFTINKYLVTFKIGDEVIAADSLEYGATIVVPEAPEKEGHTFDGWGEMADIVPAHDVTYEGSYSINSYLLTYMVDGEAVQADSVVYGAEITLLDEPTKEGYTFSGWSEAPRTMPASDVTISGTFTINKYLISFKIGDEVIAADSLEYGATIVVPEAPEKEGHIFDGWGEVADIVPAHDVTYEGSYSINSYLLTYMVDGEAVQADSAAYGAEITPLTEPVKEGYTFSGWGEVPATMPAEDVIVSGFFTINKYLVTFKIGDEVIAADSLEYGATIVVPEAPEREGYTFDGWGEVADIVPAADVTYEGTYIVNTYKVYYYVGEELVYTAEVAYGESIPEYVYEPTAEGDVFEGWIGETYEIMPAHDVTYTANITNDISQSTMADSQLTIYDLNGRKIQENGLQELFKGIYIVNGKKTVIK